MFIQESENKRNHSIIMQQFDNQLPISSLDQTTEGTKQSNPTSCTLDHWGATSTHMWDKVQNNHAGSTNQNRTNNHPYLEASEIFWQVTQPLPLLLEVRECVAAVPDLLRRQLQSRRRIGIDVEGVERGPGRRRRRSAGEAGGGPHLGSEAAAAVAGAGNQRVPRGCSGGGGRAKVRRRCPVAWAWRPRVGRGAGVHINQ